MKRNPNFFQQESPIIKLFSEKFGFYISLDLCVMCIICCLMELWESLFAEVPLFKELGCLHEDASYREYCLLKLADSSYILVQLLDGTGRIQHTPFIW